MESGHPRAPGGRQVNYSNVIVLLALPRSGTNALRSVLGSHPDIFCLDEVFALSERTSVHELTRQTNFFNFVIPYAGGDVTKLFPDRHERVFLDFLDYLGGFTSKRFIVIDVKYTTMHLLTEPYASFLHPYLFDLIVSHGLRVFNLTRKNYLRYHLSQLKAMASGQWECELGSRPVDQAIRVDIPALLNALERCEAEDHMIQSWFGGYEHYRAYEYDQAFSESTRGVAAPLLETVSDWLGIPNRYSNTPNIQKQSYLPLHLAISNYAEVAAALQGSPFAYCLEDEASYRAETVPPPLQR
jgi:hypothetical protein